NEVLAAGGVDTTHLFTPLAAALIVSAPLVTPAVPAAVVFVGAAVVALLSMVLWMELVVRSAAVAAAALFLPLALAGLVWPSVSHWARRLAETIAALVLSKFVIAAVLSLAASALSADVQGTSGGDRFGVVMVGIAMLLLATTAPFVLLRLVPAIEGGAVMHLEGARQRLRATATAPLVAGSTVLNLATSAAGSSAAGAAGAAGAAPAAGTAQAPGARSPMAASMAAPTLVDGDIDDPSNARLGITGGSGGPPDAGAGPS
ncbi:MAG: hypothetical protein ACYDD4_08860, partial [Acidimicrobiales bacterium]